MSTQSQSYTTDPLEDGSYDLRIIAVDPEGDEAVSDTATITISSAPEPPSDLSYDLDSGTLTLDATDSPSGDVDVYNIYESDSDGVVSLSDGPDYTPGSLPYDIDISTYTGTYAWLLRAEDTDGNEEANVEEMIQLSLIDGTVEKRPAEPRSVNAEPAGDLKVDVKFRYNPYYEENGPGVAYEARIYGDNATGTIDYSSPEATVILHYPTTVDTYTYTTDSLTADTYQWDVRIASDVVPDGTETTGEHITEITLDDDVPETPELEADIV